VGRLMVFVSRMCSPGDGVSVRKMVIESLFPSLTDVSRFLFLVKSARWFLRHNSD